MKGHMYVYPGIYHMGFRISIIWNPPTQRTDGLKWITIYGPTAFGSANNSPLKKSGDKILATRENQSKLKENTFWLARHSKMDWFLRINTIENLTFKIDISLAIVPYFFLQILLVVDLEVIPSRRKNANSTAFTAGFPD